MAERTVDLKELVRRGVAEGKTQRAMAEEYGCSQPMISRLAKGMKGKRTKDEGQRAQEEGQKEEDGKGLSEAALTSLTMKVRFAKARTEKMEADRDLARMNADEKRGTLVARTAVEDLVMALQGCIRDGSERLRRLHCGREAVDIFVQVLKGVDEKVKLAMELPGKK